MRLHVSEQLVVDALSGAAQRQFPECSQIAGREIVFDRALGGIREVDLAFLKPLDQVVGGQVDDLDVVGLVDDGVREPSREP